MVKHEEENEDLATIDQVQKILDELVSAGDVFAVCSVCDEYLSFAEKELMFCKQCKTKLSKDKILYCYNKAVGQNN